MPYANTAFGRAVMEQRRQTAGRPIYRHRRPPARPWWSRLAGLVTMAAIIGLVGTQAAQAMNPADPDGDVPSHSAIHGTYLFEDGEHLTLLGTGWSIGYELEGYQVGLTPDGDDRFLAQDDPAEVVSILRDDEGEVLGVVLDRPGSPQRFASRQDLFTEETVNFSSGDVRLAGTLILPKGPGPHPAVVMVHGAEFGTRESYRLLGTHYARRGVAALIYDKRGTGESSGSFSEATFENLTGDTLAAVNLLKDHAAVDPNRIGLAGFSQGGWIIAMAAERSDDVAFLIAVSAPGSSPAAEAAWLSGNLLSLRGLDARSIETARRGWGMMYSTLQLVDAGLMPSVPDVPGFWFHALDPHLDAFSMWSRVRQPVLGIWGELDCQVSARDSAPELREALVSGGNRHSTFRVLPGASHGIALVAPCAHELGGMQHHGARYRYAPGYFAAPAEWINSGFGSDSDVLLPDQPTPSPLDWHQDPNTDVPWYGTFVPQVTAFMTLVTVFSVTGVVWLWRQTFGRARNADWKRSLPWQLTGPTALAGLFATILGGMAMAELLLLGDVHTEFLIGGPLADGASQVFKAASAAAWTTTILAAALAVLSVRKWVNERSGAPKEWRSRLTTAMLPMTLVFVGLAGYWGLLSTRLPF